MTRSSTLILAMSALIAADTLHAQPYAGVQILEAPARGEGAPNLRPADQDSHQPAALVRDYGVLAYALSGAVQDDGCPRFCDSGAGDSTVLLYAAYSSARAGDEAETRALQALADRLSRGDDLFGMDGNHILARIALTLGDHGRASALMRSSGEILLDRWSTIEDPMAVMHVAHAMQTLNERIATTLRKRGDAAGVVTHQLLAARAHDLPDIGMPEMAALCRDVALETALASADGALMVVACDALLARRGDELTAREAARITLAINRLAELERVDDALDRARHL